MEGPNLETHVAFHKMLQVTSKQTKGSFKNHAYQHEVGTLLNSSL